MCIRYIATVAPFLAGCTECVFVSILDRFCVFTLLFKCYNLKSLVFKKSLASDKCNEFLIEINVSKLRVDRKKLLYADKMTRTFAECRPRINIQFLKMNIVISAIK